MKSPRCGVGGGGAWLRLTPPPRGGVGGKSEDRPARGANNFFPPAFPSLPSSGPPSPLPSARSRRSLRVRVGARAPAGGRARRAHAHARSFPGARSRARARALACFRPPARPPDEAGVARAVSGSPPGLRAPRPRRTVSGAGSGGPGVGGARPVESWGTLPKPRRRGGRRPRTRDAPAAATGRAGGENRGPGVGARLGRGGDGRPQRGPLVRSARLGLSCRVCTAAIPPPPPRPPPCLVPEPRAARGWRGAPPGEVGDPPGPRRATKPPGSRQARSTWLLGGRLEGHGFGGGAMAGRSPGRVDVPPRPPLGPLERPLVLASACQGPPSVLDGDPRFPAPPPQTTAPTPPPLFFFFLSGHLSCGVFVVLGFEPCFPSIA